MIRKKGPFKSVFNKSEDLKKLTEMDMSSSVQSEILFNDYISNPAEGLKRKEIFDEKDKLKQNTTLENHPLWSGYNCMSPSDLPLE